MSEDYPTYDLSPRDKEIFKALRKWFYENNYCISLLDLKKELEKDIGPIKNSDFFYAMDRNVAQGIIEKKVEMQIEYSLTQGGKKYIEDWGDNK